MVFVFFLKCWFHCFRMYFQEGIVGLYGRSAFSCMSAVPVCILTSSVLGCLVSWPWGETVPHWVFICFFLLTSSPEHFFFMYLLAIYISLFNKHLFIFLVHFLHGLFWVSWSSVFWMLILFSKHCLQISTIMSVASSFWWVLTVQRLLDVIVCLFLLIGYAFLVLPKKTLPTSVFPISWFPLVLRSNCWSTVTSYLYRVWSRILYTSVWGDPVFSGVFIEHTMLSPWNDFSLFVEH